MVAVQVVVDTHDAELTLTRLNTALSATGLVAFMTGSVAPYLAERAKARFDSEGDDVSGKWAALKDSTQEFRLHGGYPPSTPINHRTGQLERYITETGSDAAPIGTTGAQLTFPGDVTADAALTQKMQTAQRGRAEPRTVPRPVLGVNERDVAFVTEALMFYFAKAVGP
jgi:hypothetical protein